MHVAPTVSSPLPNWDLEAIEIVDSTQPSVFLRGLGTLDTQLDMAPSYSRSLSWSQIIRKPVSCTAVSENVKPILGPDRKEDAIIYELRGLRILKQGWDGEEAASPDSQAIDDAI